MLKYNQFFLMFIFIDTGILLGILFDLFRIQRKIVRTNQYLTVFQDVIYGIISGFLVFYIIKNYTNGDIRLYMFMNLLLGVFIYLTGLSKHFIAIFVWIINPIKKILTKIVKKFMKILEKKQ